MEMISRVVLTYLLNAIWMVTIVAAVAWLCARVLRRVGAEYEHAVWITALGFAMFLPFVSMPLAIDFHTENQNATAETAALRSISAGASRTLTFGGHSRTQPVSLAPRLGWVITVSYFGFLLFGVARFAANWRRTVRLRRASYPRALPERLSTIAQRSFAATGVRPVAILCSPQLAGPAIAGVCSPVLLLPEPFFERVEEDDFASAISHELAHIRRRDFFSNLVCEFALLPIAFHPGAVLIKKGIDRSRELACDESAARSSSTPSAYARSLLNLAAGMQTAIASAPHNYSLGLFDSDTLEERIVNLLRKPNQFSKKLGHISTALASSVLVLVCVAASAFSVQVAAKGGADLQPFVGTWQAKFNDKVFQTVVIETKDGKLTGTVTHGSVQMNDQGEMTGAELKEGSDPITAYKLEGKVLHLTVTGEANVNADGSDSKVDTTNFEITITGKDAGEIIPVDDDIKKDMPTLKPWKLERVKKQD